MSEAVERNQLPTLGGFYFVDIKTRNSAELGRDWLIGAQYRKGWPVIRISDTDLDRGIREAAAQAKVAKSCLTPSKAFRAPARVI